MVFYFYSNGSGCIFMYVGISLIYKSCCSFRQLMPWTCNAHIMISLLPGQVNSLLIGLLSFRKLVHILFAFTNCSLHTSAKYLFFLIISNWNIFKWEFWITFYSFIFEGLLFILSVKLFIFFKMAIIFNLICVYVSYVW